MSHPTTLVEWKQYISTLSGEALRSKAVAANSYRFVQTLQGEGYSASEINGIFKMLASQFVRTGQMPPTGGYLDFQELI